MYGKDLSISGDGVSVTETVKENILSKSSKWIYVWNALVTRENKIVESNFSENRGMYEQSAT